LTKGHDECLGFKGMLIPQQKQKFLREAATLRRGFKHEISPKENAMSATEAEKMIGRRASEIANTKAFRDAVEKAGCTTKEEVEKLGYMLAIATLFGPK
jgi:hypothetical protein